MNNLNERKFNKLKDILHSYDLYKGGLSSPLERKIYKLKDYLKEEDYTDLVNSYNGYVTYLLNVFARSNLVYVKLDVKVPTINFDELNLMFEDLDA